MTANETDQYYSSFKVYGSLLVGLAAFSFSPILVRYAADYSGTLLATIRTVLAVILLVPFYLKNRNEAKATQRQPSVDHIFVVVAGVSLGLHFIAWISSVYYTSVSSASVLVCIHPILVIVAERTLMKITFRPIVWLGVIISFLGTLLLGYFDFSGENTFPDASYGNFLAVLAAAIFAVYFLIGRKLRQKRNWIEYVFPVYGYAALTCVIFLFIKEGVPTQLDSKLILIGLALAVGPQILGHGSLNYAVKYVPATLLSTLILAEPVFASILAFLIFQELPLPLSIFAMVIILAGVALTWKRRRRQKLS
ncbi:MAG: EamA family transporter [Balneola sp.]